MLHRLLGTESTLAPVIARAALGAVMLPHGAQKFLGWHGGPGFDATMQYFAGLGVPSPLGVLAIVVEFFGALALLAGGLTRLAAFTVGAQMLVAAALVHLPNGFFMNWFGAQAGEGFEYHILAAALAAVLTVTGGGAWSLDRLASTPPARVSVAR